MNVYYFQMGMYLSAFHHCNKTPKSFLFCLRGFRQCQLAALMLGSQQKTLEEEAAPSAARKQREREGVGGSESPSRPASSDPVSFHWTLPHESPILPNSTMEERGY